MACYMGAELTLTSMTTNTSMIDFIIEIPMLNGNLRGKLACFVRAELAILRPSVGSTDALDGLK